MPGTISVGTDWPSPVTQNVKDNFRRSVGRAARRAMDAVDQMLISATPYESIASAYHVVQESTSDLIAYAIVNDSNIFPFVEEDTKPHEIRAKNKPRLAFMYQGHLVRPYKVNHPGTKGKYIFRDIWAGQEQVVLDAIADSIDRWWGRWGADGE